MSFNKITTLIFYILSSYTVLSQPISKTEEPLKIILLIGDGMGLSQLSSTYFYSEKEPSFSRFKNVALHKNKSSSHKITDSAAGATALSCGVKTYNGAIGKDKNKKNSETIVEYVSKLGWNTGVVATSTITHATPASFYAHVDRRAEQPEIARQLAYSDIDFFVGGGMKFFNKRLDKKNLLDTLKNQGFNIDTVLKENKNLDINQKHGFILAKGGLKAKNKGRENELMNATINALNYLHRKNNPYFLMIESSQIDWAGHENDADYLIKEMLEFDKVIDTVLDYANKNKNTLVIVTADHETGGFTLAGRDYKGAMNKTFQDYNTISPSFSTKGHSCSLIPVFAYGIGSEKIRGVIENTYIFDIMKEQVNKYEFIFNK